MAPAKALFAGDHDAATRQALSKPWKKTSVATKVHLARFPTWMAHKVLPSRPVSPEVLPDSPEICGSHNNHIKGKRSEFHQLKFGSLLYFPRSKNCLFRRASAWFCIHPPLLRNCRKSDAGWQLPDLQLRLHSFDHSRDQFPAQYIRQRIGEFRFGTESVEHQCPRFGTLDSGNPPIRSPKAFLRHGSHNNLVLASCH